MHNKIDSDSLIEKLFRKESRRLESIIRRYVPNREDAKDLVQDVFYKLLMGSVELEEIRNLTAWIFQMGKFRAIDFLRKKKPVLKSSLLSNKNEEDEDEDIFEWLMNHSPPNQDEELWQKNVWKIVEDTLQTLPNTQKEAFTLHELEGFSIKEIAEIQNVNQNTVLSRKRYAVAALKEKLVNEYNELVV